MTILQKISIFLLIRYAIDKFLINLKVIENKILETSNFGELKAYSRKV